MRPSPCTTSTGRAGQAARSSASRGASTSAAVQPLCRTRRATSGAADKMGRGTTVTPAYAAPKKPAKNGAPLAADSATRAPGVRP
ncbi:MAG: hypothetical protein IPI43_19095 [Sandaracinaceae bacterium]|nr:hypothetical protein [Sandaracinaceae bacterium]